MKDVILNHDRFRENLLGLIRQNGYSIMQLAIRSGVPRSSITSYVNGQTFPSTPYGYLLAKALGVTVEDLMKGVVE